MNALDIGFAGSTLMEPGSRIPSTVILPSLQGIHTVERMFGVPPRL
jgi:hypothetical protein